MKFINGMKVIPFGSMVLYIAIGIYDGFTGDIEHARYAGIITQIHFAALIIMNYIDLKKPSQ